MGIAILCRGDEETSSREGESNGVEGSGTTDDGAQGDEPEKGSGSLGDEQDGKYDSNEGVSQDYNDAFGESEEEGNIISLSQINLQNI